MVYIGGTYRTISKVYLIPSTTTERTLRITPNPIYANKLR